MGALFPIADEDENEKVSVGSKRPKLVRTMTAISIRAKLAANFESKVEKDKAAQKLRI